MNVVFEIECDRTLPGDCLGIVGQCSELGAWDLEKAVRLDGSSFPIWRCTVNLQPKALIEYKYVILYGNGGCMWESFDGNRSACIEANDKASGSCCWDDGKFGKLRISRSNAYEPFHETVPAVVDSSNAPVDLGSMTSHELRLTAKFAGTKPGDCVAVVGSWNWEQPIKLDGSNFPIWRGSVPQTLDTHLEYKYILLHKDGRKKWEAEEQARVLQPSEFSSRERDDGVLQFHVTSKSDKNKRCIETGGDGIITGEKQTIYGRVSLDYGSLEERMAKRMNQPVQLHGDCDEEEHFHRRLSQKANLECDWGALEKSVASRAAAWPLAPCQAMPPSTRVGEDSSSEFTAIVAFEGRGAVTLCERFKLAHELLSKMPEGSAAQWTVLIWLRFSASRQLTWQRKSNTRPYLLSEAAEKLSHLIAQRFIERPAERFLWRLMLGVVPRGGHGDQGQAIRDDILKIMARWQLKKRKGDFMEQWHQKLHNNTTPDDIFICEAYLCFLRSNGDLNQFYGHLAACGVDRERLQTFERPILQEPVFFPSIRNGLINDFEKYLVVLKTVHAGADLEKCVDEATDHGVDARLKGILEAILTERGANADRIVVLLAAVAEARVYEPGSRSGLYLDLALENHARLLVERFDTGQSLRCTAVCAALLLENVCRTVGSLELRAAFRDFAMCLGHDGEYEKLRVAAVTERARNAIADAANILTTLQSRAEDLGAALRKVTPEELPESWAVNQFVEEFVRGGPGFGASLMFKHYEQRYREDAGGLPWQLVSVTAARSGTLHVVHTLKTELKFDVPSIVLTEVLSGEEDPPEGTVAVLTPNAVDVLSHVAVRARTMGIFLATCFDEAVLESLRKLQGHVICVGCKAGTVVYEEVDATQALPSSGAQDVPRASIIVERPPPSWELWVPEGKLSSCPQAGAKSKNLAALRAGLPDWVKQPTSVVVPFGVLDRVFTSPENCLEHARFKNLESQLERCRLAAPLLDELRTCVRELKLPLFLSQGLQVAVESLASGSRDSAWWEALKAVWASCWNDRAFYACSRAGIALADVAMAVLVQQLVSAEYSFVVHTQDPTGDPHDMYAEVVVGLGEVLVGNYPGRALGFTSPRDASRPPRLRTLPSKSAALFGSGLIFRSDSNSEDLEHFAGAGLFDSIPVQKQQLRILEYRGEKLIEDMAFQKMLLGGIVELARSVEAAAGGNPQDIEGCYAKGEFFVVQTRPQA